MNLKEEAFWETFEAAIPNYESINNDPVFHKFMKNKQLALDIAKSSLDAPLCISIYEAFKQKYSFFDTNLLLLLLEDLE